MLPSPIPNTVSENYVRELSLIAHIGQAAESDRQDVIGTLVVARPSTAEVRTLTLTGGFSAGTVYTATIAGFVISYTSVAGDTDMDGVATSFAAAINANPNIRGLVEAAGGTSAVILTALTAQQGAFTLTAGTNTSAALTTSSASASEVPFGRLVFFRNYSSQRGRELDKLGKIADSSDLAAQVDTLQITAYDASSTVVLFFYDENGHLISSLSVAHNTNVNTTASDVEAALDADLALVEKGITASVATDTVTITAGTAGQTFTMEAYTNGAGTHATTSTKALATSLALSAFGVSLRRLDVASGTVGDSSDVAYQAGEAMDVMRKGDVWVEIDTSETLPTYQGEVYVDLTAGAGAGKFYTVAGSGRLLLSGARWLASNSSAGLGLLSVDLAA